MSGFTVRGTLDETPYEVEVTGDPGNPVTGSSRVTGLFRQYDGEAVLATPNGPKYVVSGGDAASVLALLQAHTTVESVGSDGETVPTLLDPRPPGTVR